MGLGMPEALYAIVLGNIILAIYASLIGMAAADGGLNTPLQIKEAFGKKSRIVTNCNTGRACERLVRISSVACG